MPHGKKAASKTPMGAYVDGCRATWISTGHPTKTSRRSSSRPTMPRVQDALPSLDCRAWKGRSNPLLLSALRFAPESRPAAGGPDVAVLIAANIVGDIGLRHV